MDKIIEALKVEPYRWKPVRRMYIPKSNGKSRPSGLPSGDDKLLQSAMRLLLEAYYEPTFSGSVAGLLAVLAAQGDASGAHAVAGRGEGGGILDSHWRNGRPGGHGVVRRDHRKKVTTKP